MTARLFVQKRRNYREYRRDTAASSKTQIVLLVACNRQRMKLTVRRHDIKRIANREFIGSELGKLTSGLYAHTDLERLLAKPRTNAVSAAQLLAIHGNLKRQVLARQELVLGPELSRHVQRNPHRVTRFATNVRYCQGVKLSHSDTLEVFKRFEARLAFVGSLACGRTELTDDFRLQ